MLSVSSLLALAHALSGPDARLAPKIAGGDHDAFKSLFDRYHLELFRFLVRMGVSSEGAEDILQDVFVGVWEGRERLDPSRSLRAYLYRSCRNRAANHFRDRAKHTGVPGAEQVADAPLQDEQLAFSQLQDRLDQAVAALPARRRAVFEMCYINGLSYKEAAAALEISPKTVENQMGHALKSLRQHLAPYLNRDE